MPVSWWIRPQECPLTVGLPVSNGVSLPTVPTAYFRLNSIRPTNLCWKLGLFSPVTIFWSPLFPRRVIFVAITQRAMAH